MSIDPATVDLRSLAALREAFRAAPEPTLELLVGEHEATFVGPGWLRAAAGPSMWIVRMPGWCGKRFSADDDGDGVIAGFNLVRRRGVVSESIPITASLSPSRLDGRPAIGVAYPADAPFPWPRVRDEFRAFGAGVLLGMTFGIPLAPPGGAPFLLRRQ
jgi:hypothetical protein